MGEQVDATRPQEEEKYAAWLAIDWADKKHVWAMISADSSQRQQGELQASPEAVEAWSRELLGRWPGQKIAVALEQKRGPLLCLLSKYRDLVLYPVHPATVSRMRSALYPSQSKNDPKDAELLLDILLHHRKHLRRLNSDTEKTRKLQMLVEDRRTLVDQQKAYSNQLQARLKLYFPQAVRWLGDLNTELAYQFLQRWPTLPVLQQAHGKTVERFFHQHHCRSEVLLQRRLEEIPDAVVATRDEAIVECATAMVKALLELLRVLRIQIAAFQQQIEELTAVHPELPWVASLPGAGPVMEPRLIAALGTERERFRNAGDLQNATGISPVQQSSGGTQWTHFRWACPKFTRQTFHEWAGHSIAHCSWAKAYYDAQRFKNKGHHAAVRALAFKWQRILFRCWKDKQPYDEQKHLHALRHRGSPYAPPLA